MTSEDRFAEREAVWRRRFEDQERHYQGAYDQQSDAWSRKCMAMCVLGAVIGCVFSFGTSVLLGL